MTLPVRIDADASQELAAAARWYEDRKMDLGSEFLGAVEAVLRRIADWPKAARPLKGVKASLGVRRSPVPGFPYYVAYVEEPDAIRILAVAHTRRRPLYWRKRL